MAVRDDVSRWLERGGRWLLACVWIVAGVPKLLEPKQFGEVISAYGLLPDGLIMAAAVILPLAELAAAWLLLVNHRAGLYLSTLLLALFISVLSYGIWLGLDIDCGCFGPEDPEHQAFAGLRTALIRDLLLVIPLGYSFRQQKKNTKPLGERQ